MGKRNVGISSTIVLVSLVSYGTYDWSRHTASFQQAPTPTEDLYLETPLAYLCYTNHFEIYTQLRRHPNVFAGKVSKTGIVFLSTESELIQSLHLIPDPLTGSCYKRVDPFLYHCCSYSPFVTGNEDASFKIRQSSFTYHRRIISDNFIRIEDILTGKPIMLDQTIELTTRSSNDTVTKVTAHHRCRGDTRLDPYPEVHISSETVLAGSSSFQEFHWFL